MYVYCCAYTKEAAARTCEFVLHKSSRTCTWSVQAFMHRVHGKAVRLKWNAAYYYCCG